MQEHEAPIGQQIEEIQVSMEEAKSKIDLRDAINRLQENKDFQLVINEGYFKDNAVQLTHSLSDMNLQAEEIQADILKQLQGIGMLRRYFRDIYAFAQQAENAMGADRETLAELHRLEAEEASAMAQE